MGCEISELKPKSNGGRIVENEKHVIEREIQITFKPKEDFVKKETYIGYRFANEKSWYWRDRRDNFFVKLFRLRPFGGERLELIARRLLDDGWKCIELTGDKGSVGEFKRRVGQKRFNFEEMEENRKLQKEFQEKRKEGKRKEEENKKEENKKEKETLSPADKVRIKKVRENEFGQLKSLFKGFDHQKICYWCGAEQNFLEYISGLTRGQSYKYVNSDGTPDKRYRDNPMSIKFDAKYQCKNCSAEIECRHYSNEEPYEDGLVSVGHVTKKGVTKYNETELLRDRKTEKVAKLPDDKDFSDYCNSNNTYFHRPWYV